MEIQSLCQEVTKLKTEKAALKVKERVKSPFDS